LPDKIQFLIEQWYHFATFNVGSKRIARQDVLFILIAPTIFAIAENYPRANGWMLSGNRHKINALCICLTYKLYISARLKERYHLMQEEFRSGVHGNMFLSLLTAIGCSARLCLKFQRAL
jgi:hypothetical protein